MNIEINITNPKDKKILNDFLDDFVISAIANKLEKEFVFYENDQSNQLKYVASDCFVSPPRTGELYKAKDQFYIILNVINVFGSNSPSYIILEKTESINIPQ